jgi:hypothetical protein
MSFMTSSSARPATGADAAGAIGSRAPDGLELALLEHA